MATLRVACTADVPDMLRIYAPYVTETAVSFEYQPPSAQEFASRFAQTTRQFPWIACEVEGQLAGYAYAHAAFARAAYQWDADVSVYLGAGQRRRGLGTALYQCLENLLRVQGYYTLYACVTGSNTDSLVFHEARGFRAIGTWRNSGYKLGRWHDVVWLEKPLRDYDSPPHPPIPFPDLPASTVRQALRPCAAPAPQAVTAG